MTIIDLPTSARRTTAHPTDPSARPTRATVPAQHGGTYVTTRSPRAATEGAYVTSSADKRFGRVSALRRGTYVSTATPTPQLGGYYTYSG
ncbi:hypothetical protein PTW37_01120 [Arthrobacter agilis]|uniref:hypothetical protein n=1 Tax=Arthrobacter agilis TaxID=37921 RepID=UPI002364FEBC|nr:hypothetical protein [Arthrobacter agilis]WDF33566.1 hypothetical protein PTW37_01120 [Arthrobacter agilis]